MKYYEKGGVYFISSQVLILDLLKKQVNRKIGGIIVLHAERALGNYDECFIITMARKLGVGFVQCISVRFLMTL